MGAGGSGGLFGRNVELAQLAASVARAHRGDAHAVLIRGEAGIGKSRLVDALVVLASDAGFGIWRASGDVTDRDRPFGALLDAIGGPDARIDDLLDQRPPAFSLVAAAIPELRARVADAVVGLVASAVRERPMALVVEDLHWVDPATLMSLRTVVRRATGSPLLLVATTRPLAGEAAIGLDALVDDGAVLVELGPLDDAALADLARELLGRSPGPRVSALLARVGGNPFLAIELVRGLADEHLLGDDGDLRDDAVDLVPRSMSQQVLRTVDQAGVAARGVLRVGAVLGSSFSASDLAAVSGLAPGALLDATDAALRSGLLCDTGSRLAFRHDVLRDVIYDSLPAAVRAGAHRQVAAALAANGAPASRVAVHFGLGAEPGDREAVSWLRTAARESVASSPTAAADLLARALELDLPGSDTRPQVLVEYMEALGLSGRLDDAERIALDVVHQLRDPRQLAEVERRRAALLLLRNRPTDSADLLESTSRLVEGELAGVMLAEAALAALAGADLGRARVDAEAARTKAMPSAGGAGESLALTVLSRLTSLGLDFEGSLELAREAVAVADRDASLEAHRYQPLFFLGLTLHDLDLLDETIEAARTAQRVADDAGMAYAAPLHHALLAMARWSQGDVDVAAAEARTALVLCEETGSTLAVVMAQALLAMAALHEDDVPTATAAVAAGEVAAAVGPALLGADLLMLASARMKEVGGDVEGALDDLLGAWELLDAIDAPPMGANLGRDIARMAVATGQAERARPIVERLDKAAAVIDLPSWHGMAAVTRGLVDGDVDSLVAAVDALRSSPRRLLLGEACEHAGRARLTSGDDAAGRALLEEAVDVFEGCGAWRDRARVASLIRSAGGRVQRTRAGRAGNPLSPSEQAVARLVTEGLSNPEIAKRLFISRRTVETHLRRVFAKLGFSSRVELAMWVERNT